MFLAILIIKSMYAHKHRYIAYTRNAPWKIKIKKKFKQYKIYQLPRKISNK